VHSLAAAFLSILAMAAAPMAIAADRNASVDESHKPVSESSGADGGATARDDGAEGSSLDSRALSAGVCAGAASAVEQGCNGDRGDDYVRIRGIDWSSVGPSTDDFAPVDDTLRLQGARLVGKYRF
jgi:hypothetical protein